MEIAIIVLTYAVYRIIKHLKNRNDNKMNLAILGLVVYISVIALALIASLITPIFVTRYTIPVVGLLIVFLSYIFATEKYKILTGIAGTVIIILYIANFMVFYSQNYNKNILVSRSPKKVFKFVRELCLDMKWEQWLKWIKKNVT